MPAAPPEWQGTASLKRHLFPSAVKSNGAVSPAARAMASRMPVVIPFSAVGSMILSVVFQRGMPIARPASRYDWGTSRIISSVVRVTVGIMSIASATPPASAEKCFIGSTTMI